MSDGYGFITEDVGAADNVKEIRRMILRVVAGSGCGVSTGWGM